MPDQFGNATPQELLQQLSDARDAMMARAGTGQQGRETVAYTIGRMISAGMDPRIMQAKKIQDAVSASQSTPRQENESEIDYQLRVGSDAFERIRKIDPTSAAKILDQNRKLEQENLNRQILLQQKTMNTNSIAEETRKQTLRKDFENTAYIVDMKGQNVVGQVSLDDPEYDKKVSEFTQGNPMRLAMSKDDMIKIVDDPAKVGKMVSVQQFAKLSEQIDENYKQAVTATQLNDIIGAAWQKDGQNVLSDLSGVTQQVNRIVGSVDEAKAWYYHQNGESVSSYLTAGAGKPLYERARNKGITISLMTGLAYMLAQARNDRVTDADLEAALKMLGGEGGDARTALAVIDEQLRNTELTNGTIESSIYDGGKASDGGLWGDGQYNLLDKKFSRSKAALADVRSRMAETRKQIFGVEELQPLNLTPTAPKPAGARNFTLTK